MTRRIKEYTVGQLARASGISVRTLHHYDAIGLLRPAHVAANGYRLYREAEALRLQEILFYRAAGMPLADIEAVLSAEDPLARLSQHRMRLAKQIDAQTEMLATLDLTIAHLKGDRVMTLDELYKPFAADTQAAYEDWLVERLGPDMDPPVGTGGKEVDHAAGMEALKIIEADLVSAYESGVTAEQADLFRHQAWVGRMWGKPCSTEAYAGLADLYEAHPDFVARYEKLSEGFCTWLTTAMRAWARKLSTDLAR